MNALNPQYIEPKSPLSPTVGRFASRKPVTEDEVQLENPYLQY